MLSHHCNLITRKEKAYCSKKETEVYCTVIDKSLVAWVQVDLECPSNIFVIFFLQEMAHFNPNSFLNNVLVPNKTAEKHSNIHSLVKPTESDFGKTKVLSLTHKRAQKCSECSKTPDWNITQVIRSIGNKCVMKPGF